MGSIRHVQYFLQKITSNLKPQGVVSYPISQGKIINFAAMVLIPDGEGKRHDGPTVIEASKQDLVDIYKGWEKEVVTRRDSR